VKRVAGLPGETITLENGDVYVEGQILRKDLDQQQILRQLVHREMAASQRWRPHQAHSGWHNWKWIDDAWAYQSVDRQQRAWLHYDHVHKDGIRDDSSYNQQETRQLNPMIDVMITMHVRASGIGELLLRAHTDDRPLILALDLGSGHVSLWQGDKRLVHQAMRASRVRLGDGAELVFSIFDRQALLAINGIVEFALPWERSGDGREPAALDLSIGARGLTVEIGELTLWRDAYYAVRHRDWAAWRRWNDFPIANAQRSDVRWRLGANQFFVLGDNAAISDDSRSWQHGPGLDARLLVGRPLGVR
jgi:hypothetical protein